MRNLVWLGVSLLFPLAVQARDWQVDATQSTLTFQATYQKEAFAGRFKKFDAAIAYDESDPSKGKFDVTVDVASVDTQSSERDDTLKGADFFDPKHYAQAHFVTTSFAKAADGSVIAHGTLTIRNAEKPVALKVKFVANADKATLDVDTTLKRAEFGLGLGKDWDDIDADVPVHAHLVLSGK
jgi:polyisoprenoid-binding protein YceI